MHPEAIAAAFIRACDAELAALKAGNVHRFSAGHGMEVAHFEAAARAAAPHVGCAGARLGTRIEGAVAASLAATGLNTNLGIVLLCAPLALAAERGGPLRDGLRAVLDDVDAADAEATFRAIAAARPGGLGRHESHDVTAPPRIGLIEAMALAAERDRVARQYTSAFADVFELGLPRLAALAEAAPEAGAEEAGAEAVHLAFLAAFPDSHIARKFGPEAAAAVRREAMDVAAKVDFTAKAARRHPPLLAFDASLKRRGLNPGTTADLTVATLFAAALTP